MSIGDEFNNDFDDTAKFPEIPIDWRLSCDRWYAFLGARWMADKIQKDAMTIFNDQSAAAYIRKLAKELE